MMQGKRVLEQYSNLGGSRKSTNLHDCGSNKQEAREVLGTAYEYVADMLQQMGSLFGKEVICDDLQRNIPSWKPMFDLYAAELDVGTLCDSILGAIRSAVCTAIIMFSFLFYYELQLIYHTV